MSTEMKKLANPGPLGLSGFGMTTVLLNLHNTGLLPLSIAIVAMGIALGDFTGNHRITSVAGFEGIFCGLSAIYSAMGQIIFLFCCSFFFCLSTTIPPLYNRKKTPKRRLLL